MFIREYSPKLDITKKFMNLNIKFEPRLIILDFWLRLIISFVFKSYHTSKYLKSEMCWGEFRLKCVM